VSCPSLPGRPLICADSLLECPVLCQPGYIVCGLQRVDGRLVVGTEGLPLPNCVMQNASSGCVQPTVRPSPANITGGSGSQSWSPIALSGTTDDGRDAGSIAEIGNDSFGGGPTFFAGNGTDATAVVKVKHVLLNNVTVRHHHFAVRRRCGCRLYSAVLPSPPPHSLHRALAHGSSFDHHQIRSFCKPNPKWPHAVPCPFRHSIAAHQVCCNVKWSYFLVIGCEYASFASQIRLLA
jgi:hypothetical protein